MTISGNDSAVYQGGVGAKSFSEPGNPDGQKGWTHTSDWTALDLTEAANLTVTLARQAGVSTFGALPTPAMSIYQGWGTGPTGPDGEWHTFNSTGNLTAVDPDNFWTWSVGQMSYLDSDGNPLSLTSLTKTISLAAGHYTLNFSGNPADQTLGGTQGYQATLATAPVPLPAAVWLFGSGLIGLIGFARRRMAS